MYQKTTKGEPELSNWDAAAIAYAKARPSDDGKVGFVVKNSHAGDEWVRYFKSIGMRSRASFLKHQLNIGGSITMPTEFPHQYDPTFVPGIYRPDKDQGPQELERERQRVIAKFKSMGQDWKPVKPLGKTEVLLNDIEKRQAAERWLADANARELTQEPIKVSEKLKGLMKPPIE